MSASYGEWGSIVTLFRRPIKAGRGWALFKKCSKKIVRGLSLQSITSPNVNFKDFEKSCLGLVSHNRLELLTLQTIAAAI